MILYPPVRLDANEWFLIMMSVVTWTTIFLLPRRFSSLTILVVWMFILYLGQTVDFILGKPPIVLYINNDLVAYEFFDILMYIIAFPPFGYLFLYLLDLLSLKGWQLFRYVLLWALVTTIIEWVATRFFHVFTFTGWKSLYSFIAYILVYYLHVVVFRFVQRYQLKSSRQS